MTAQATAKKQSKQPSDFEHKVQQLRKLYADASDISKTALENVISGLSSGAPAATSATKMESAGRIGARQGKVAELTAILPLRPGAAKRMRAFF
jgi:hypothetical protein